MIQNFENNNIRPKSALTTDVSPPSRRKIARTTSASIQGRRRPRKNLLAKEEHYWNNDITRSDRDELTRALDNQISKSRDIVKVAIPPKYDPKAKCKKPKSWKIRSPLKTSGPIFNLKLACQLYNPPKYQIHPDNLEGFERYKFGTDKFTKETTARPITAVDMSSEALRRTLRTFVPKEFGQITVLKDISTLKGKIEDIQIR